MRRKEQTNKQTENSRITNTRFRFSLAQTRIIYFTSTITLKNLKNSPINCKKANKKSQQKKRQQKKRHVFWTNFSVNQHTFHNSNLNFLQYEHVFHDTFIPVPLRIPVPFSFFFFILPLKRFIEGSYFFLPFLFFSFL